MTRTIGFQDSVRPTPGQRRYIAILSAGLQMPEPDVRSYGEAGRMIRELEAERSFRKRVKSNALMRACYNSLATHGEALHYEILTRMVQERHPELKTTANSVLAILSMRRDAFRKVSTGVYFLANKSEGRTYPEL